MSDLVLVRLDSILPVDPATYGLFLAVMGVMAVTPGPANLFAIATGVAQGPRAALLGVAGMNAATLVWFAAAALGLGALVTAFPDQFHLLAIAGAIYVGWLGFKAWAAAWRGAPAAAGKAELAQPNRAPFLRGFAVQIANPKAILFFTAVLPPFLDPSRPAAPQLGAFAVATIGLDVLAMGAYGLAGAKLAERLRQPRFARAFNFCVGALLLTAAGLILLRG